jgi:hypothetical protein
LIQRQWELDFSVFPWWVNSGKRKTVCIMPVIAVQLDECQIGHGINGTFKYTQSFVAPGLFGYSKREALITAGNISGKGGLGGCSSQSTIAWFTFFKAYEYAVMTFSVLVELTMFNAVVDDLRVNATAIQI